MAKPKIKTIRNEEETFEIVVIKNKEHTYFTAYDMSSQFSEKGRNGYWLIEKDNVKIIDKLTESQAKQMVKNLAINFAKSYMRTH
jgi:hypothetical protein